MINDFLRKYQEELISDKIQLKEDMDLLETKINEENKFRQKLDKMQKKEPKKVKGVEEDEPEQSEDNQ